MIITVNVDTFRNAFENMSRGNSFSYEGLGVLFEFLDSEYDGNQELDVIAIDCEWNECTIEELWNDYGYMMDEDDMVLEEDERNDALIAMLENNTTVLTVSSDTYIVASF